MKYVRITDEAHRKAKTAAAIEGMTQESWITLAILRGAQDTAKMLGTIGTAVNSRGAQEQRGARDKATTAKS